MKRVVTLCLIRQGTHILLGHKKRGFGEGKWNGFGGKVESGETIEQAAKREVYEETGLVVEALERIGQAEFEFKNDPVILDCHIFATDQFVNEPIETEEMKPKWFHVDELPFDLMWADDRHWFPLFLAGKKFTGKFWFDGHDIITRFELSEVRNT